MKGYIYKTEKEVHYNYNRLIYANQNEAKEAGQCQEFITAYYLICLKDGQEFMKVNMFPINNQKNLDIIRAICNDIRYFKDGEYILDDNNGHEKISFNRKKVTFEIGHFPFNRKFIVPCHVYLLDALEEIKCNISGTLFY